MIHIHDIQNAILGGPRTTPSDDGESLAFVPVYVEILLPSGPKLVPVTAVRVEKGRRRRRYVLTIEATGLVLSLAERVAGQSEILSKRAEGKTINMREGSGY